VLFASAKRALVAVVMSVDSGKHSLPRVNALLAKLPERSESGFSMEALIRLVSSHFVMLANGLVNRVKLRKDAF
jgi:hypothetical protein